MVKYCRMETKTKDFIKGINNKNSGVWRKFYKDYFNPLCHHAFKILKDEHIASDIVQETLIKLWESNTRFDNIKALTVYVYRAVNNSSLNYIRNKKTEDIRLQQWAFVNGDISNEAFSSIVTEEVVRKLRSLIMTLPVDRREVLFMSMSGMKGEEIAEELGVTVYAVKQHKYRAYKYIKEKMDSDFFTILFFFLSI